MTGRVEVVRAGALTTVQDAGRGGWAHLGVPRSGALDAPAHRLANRLAGNPGSAAVLETTVTGCAVRPDRPVVAVVGGAPCRVTVDGRPVAWGAPVRVPAGAVLDAGPAARGLRSYLAFGGGLLPEPVLGSRSADLLSGLGPPPLRDGDVLPLGYATGAPTPVADAVPWPAAPDVVVLPVHLGPRHDWFTDAGLRTLTTAAYRVSPQSNRIGLRTEGPALERARTDELPSEGMVLGAVQVPPDGRPVVFLNDHPTTGGYPVVGVVAESALAAAAQAGAGTPVRFVRAGG
ncbi:MULTISPECIES: biotin-dependent carboxyltransferase family protein [unclassified Streptomyces]|uniref:5-oxoprolinase subunit C family protein n=1 Tax=unclassified Streptomyces TaxID=2593676 RepID=UPI002ED15544|nr:biotin-dependent carboxyltransferase family protein [Streptomyces sp. NBC_00891]WSY06913.1 biotin-dependent carboxyltransferase family protein [Streptomyces sp. NBC_00890]WSZ08539.1 biotin-dependent carboxyltransferase family protein [Streptomyces sp. NBC_00869]WSZ23962.1 biotin-dependent carboxyltransferase family protein [Streptomyces sp. NBC_00870]